MGNILRVPVGLQWRNTREFSTGVLINHHVAKIAPFCCFCVHTIVSAPMTVVIRLDQILHHYALCHSSCKALLCEMGYLDRRASDVSRAHKRSDRHSAAVDGGSGRLYMGETKYRV